MNSIIKDKLMESVRCILPIAGIVFLLSLTLTPMNPGTFLLFLFGVVFLIIGLSVFNVGAEISMQTLGTKIGLHMASSKKLWLSSFLAFVIGMLITISEPDLQILASQVSDVPNMVLILVISLGVGVFLTIALLRVFFGVSLSFLLMIFYAITFVLAFFVPQDFLAVSFDSGGVTTGPMTVPFIIAFGAGLSASRAESESHDDSFGMVALCSIGPILAVLILGIFYRVNGGTYTPTPPQEILTTRDGIGVYLHGFVDTISEVGVALLPIVAFAAIFQLFTKAFSLKQLIRIGIGILYTFFGLVLFLTGANQGFLPTGSALGETLANILGGWLLIPIGMVIGYFLISAEPAVHVLNKQVEQLTAGAIPSSTIHLSLSIAAAASLGLSMLRILTGLPVIWILLPGYAIALILSFFTPKIFTGIAFDSGGVASGAMMSAFVLPMAIGACGELGGNIMTQAFGCVSLSAMTPIISIQVCGLVYKMKSHLAVSRFIAEEEVFYDYLDEEETA